MCDFLAPSYLMRTAHNARAKKIAAGARALERWIGGMLQILKY